MQFSSVEGTSSQVWFKVRISEKDFFENLNFKNFEVGGNFHSRDFSGEQNIPQTNPLSRDSL